MSEWWWSWLLMLSGLSTMYLAGRKLWWAWLVGIGTEALWIVYAVQTSQPGFVIFALVYAVIYANNAWRWYREPMSDPQGRL